MVTLIYNNGICVRCGSGGSWDDKSRLPGEFLESGGPRGKPLTVVSFADSMGDSYRSITMVMMDRLVERFGVAGHSLGNYKNAIGYQLESGAQMIGPGPFWFAVHYRVPPAAAVCWENRLSAGGVRCNKAGVFYVSHSGGGAFNLCVSTNTGPWTTALTVDAYSEMPEGHFAKLDLPLDSYRIRVEGISGTNYIIGPQLLDTTSGGLHSVFCDYGGIAVYTATSVPVSIRLPVFRELAPDLLIWHFKDGNARAVQDGMIACEQWWSAAAPSCDVLCIGTPYSAVDTNSNFTVDQNTLVRMIASTYDRAYVDLMTPAVSYPWMMDQGFLADDTHLNKTGSTYFANIAWNDLGLYGLRRQRTLMARSTSQGLVVEYPTSAGVGYVLESSADGVSWTGVSTNAGTGGVLKALRDPGAERELFRLRLVP